MVKYGSLFLLLPFVLSSLTLGNFVLIRTHKGLIRGRKEESGLFVFQGIPYAEPPRRFHPSKFHSPWTGVRNTTSQPPPCPQEIMSNNNNELQYSEDCLFLSIYTPNLGSKNGRHPVWVWIHGGDFSKGSISQEGSPAQLSRMGIVVVLIQYRLGPFGFTAFTEGDDRFNLGFLDQALAMDWVKRNIKRFGGDPQRIILGGSGSGGHSAARLALKGEYSGLILSSSGIAETSWVSSDRDNAIESTRELGARLYCPTNQDLKSCLSTKSVEEILQSDLNFIPVRDSSDLETAFYKKKFKEDFALLIGDSSYDENLDIDTQLKMHLSEDHIHKVQITPSIYQQIIFKLFPKYPPSVSVQSNIVARQIPDGLINQMQSG